MVLYFQQPRKMVNALGQNSGLNKLCTRGNQIRSNYFSDTFRAELKVGSEFGTWDIIHISLPFSPLKEREFMVRFGLDKSQMLQFYKQFGHCIKNDIRMTNFLSESEVKSVVKYVSYVIEKKEAERGSDIYLITRPMESFTEKMQWNAGDESDSYEVITFAARILQIIKGINAVSSHFGVLDMDNVFIIEEGEKNLVTLGGFLYGAQDEGSYIELPAVMPAHTCPSIPAGQAPSSGSDIYSICSLIWTMLDGNHYTTAPDLSRPPIYAPQNLVPIMEKAMKCHIEGTSENLNTNDIIAELTRTVRTTIKLMTNGTIQKRSFIIADPTYNISEAYRLYRKDPVSATQEEERKAKILAAKAEFSVL